MNNNVIDDIIYQTNLLKEFNEIEGIFGGKIIGYNNLDKQGDIIMQDAFKEDVEAYNAGNKSVFVFHEHDPYKMLASKPIELVNKSDGVYATFKVDEKAKEIHKNIWEKLPQYYEAGILGFSVGIQKAMTTKLVGGRYMIHKGVMKEFSTTINPANPQAKANIMKSMEEIDTLIKSISSFSKAEEFLRKNTDFTQGQCNTIIKNILAINKNSSPAQDCQSNQPVQVQKTAIEEVFGL